LRPPSPTTAARLAAVAFLLPLVAAAAALAAGPAAPAASPTTAAATASRGGEEARERGPEPLDPAVAACLLSRLGRAQTEASAGLLLEACSALVGPGDGGAAAGPSLLVECRVSGDPEWARVRLLTRRQCADVGGRTGTD
jgi:hypothetical protein